MIAAARTIGRWSAKVTRNQRTGRDHSVALAAIIYDKGFRIDDFMASVAAPRVEALA